MKILVTGDRNWIDKDYIFSTLDFYHKSKGIDLVIEGGAQGADLFAGQWAEENKILCEVFPADWKSYGRAAGPIRNQQMLDETKPDIVLAFHNDIHNSKGTKDMITRAEKKGIKVILHAPDALIKQSDFGFDPDMSPEYDFSKGVRGKYIYCNASFMAGAACELPKGHEGEHWTNHP